MESSFYGLLVATIVSLILAIWRFTQQKATLKQQAYLQQEKQAALKNRQGARDDDNESKGSLLVTLGILLTVGIGESNCFFWRVLQKK